jgi:hypothetical protein
MKIVTLAPCYNLSPSILLSFPAFVQVAMLTGGLWLSNPIPVQVAMLTGGLWLSNPIPLEWDSFALDKTTLCILEIIVVYL